MTSDLDNLTLLERAVLKAIDRTSGDNYVDIQSGDTLRPDLAAHGHEPSDQVLYDTLRGLREDGRYVTAFGAWGSTPGHIMRINLTAEGRRLVASIPEPETKRDQLKRVAVTSERTINRTAVLVGSIILLMAVIGAGIAWAAGLFA
jgi:hypothetical protein